MIHNIQTNYFEKDFEISQLDDKIIYSCDVYPGYPMVTKKP